MILAAPASAAPAIAAAPTPPQPMTATVEPRPTLPVLIAAPRPAITPQPRRPTAAARATGRLRALTRGDQRLLGERADAQRGRQLGAGEVALGERHLLGGVVGGEAVPRLAAVAGAAVAAHGAPVEDDEVTRLEPGHVRTDRLDQAGRLVAEEEGEVVVDPALAVVQVGVAHPAGLDLHHRLARAGIGDVDRGELHRLALRERDDGLDLLHGCASCGSVDESLATQAKQMQPPADESRPHPDTPHGRARGRTGGGR